MKCRGGKHGRQLGRHVGATHRRTPPLAPGADAAGKMWRAMLLLAFMLLSPVHGRTAEEKESMKKAIRMKTTRQLKEIFDELEIDHKGLSKEELQTKAYKEDAIGRWETLHPEKKKKPRPASRGGGGGGGYGGMPGMEGMKDVPGMEDLMRQMRGDFSGEPDPEKRRILEKLAKKGMSFGGGNNMDLEQLKNMEKMMDGINLGKQGEGEGLPGRREAKAKASPDVDEAEFDDEDKMEL